jgi:acyl-CoA reductase-like NAD-dependent aldehyde dehydrogenase
MRFKTVSPIDGRVVFEGELADLHQAHAALAVGQRAWMDWRRRPLSERTERVQAFVQALLAERDELALEICLQMGRPLSQCGGELSGFADRANTMISLAESGLKDVMASPNPGFSRFVRREPLGLVLVLAAWNYPYLIAVNSIIPALLSGNVVLLKHSDQTPLCAERLSVAAAKTLPPGVLQHLHMSHETVAQVIPDERVAFVAFTGSVEGGRAVHKAAGGHFKGVGLELGGKDPAYVRADADLDFTVPNLVDGAMFNSGQSCCGIERIYVHQDLYREVVERMEAEIKSYKLGNPLQDGVNMGPVVRTRSALMIRQHIAQAVSMGAKAVIDPRHFAADTPEGPYVAPQLVIDASAEMDIVAKETFGPVVAVMPVSGDEDAIAAMNNSRFGLTASIWTDDGDSALRIGERLETGTVFQNRCDYLDPELAWVGVKDSGRGCTLSVVGFENLTRPKSFHLRTRGA